MPYTTMSGEQRTTVSVRLDNEELRLLDELRHQMQASVSVAGPRVTRSAALRRLILDRCC